MSSIGFHHVEANGMICQQGDWGSALFLIVWEILPSWGDENTA
jgi:hypothetical protein